VAPYRKYYCSGGHKQSVPLPRQVLAHRRGATNSSGKATLMAVFWVVACLVWLKFATVSEVLAASIIRANRWHTSARLHGATTQKTAIFVLTTVRTSNPTKVTLLIQSAKSVIILAHFRFHVL
jgi:hypothetical protein